MATLKGEKAWEEFLRRYLVLQAQCDLEICTGNADTGEPVIFIDYDGQTFVFLYHEARGVADLIAKAVKAARQDEGAAECMSFARSLGAIVDELEGKRETATLH